MIHYGEVISDNYYVADRVLKMLTKKLLTVLTIICLSATAALAETGTKAPIKIGAIYGFTGFSNIWSAQARRGIEMARDEINNAGGINGRPLEIIFEDSQTTPRGAVTAFNKLAHTDRVSAIVGDIISFVTLPLVPLAQNNKIVLITPSIFNSDLPANSDYFFTTCPRKESIKPPVERFFALNADVKKVAIICADNTWGRTYLDIWREAAKTSNVEIVDENCISDYSSDMRSEILRAKSKQPDAVIVAFAIDRAIRKMRELKFSPKILTTSDLDEAIHNRGFPAADAEGVYFADWLAAESFRRRFSERFNDAPIMAPQNSYEAVKILGAALQRNKGDLQESISSLRYTGEIGPIDFQNSRAGNRASATLMRVSDGKVGAVPETSTMP